MKASDISVVYEKVLSHYTKSKELKKSTVFLRHKLKRECALFLFVYDVGVEALKRVNERFLNAFFHISSMWLGKKMFAFSLLAVLLGS